MKEYTYNEYKIRKIRPEDNAAVAALVRYNLKQNKLDVPGTAYFDPCLADLCSFYERGPCCGYYVLVDETGKVVGGIGFDKTDHFPDGAELQKLYLDDSVKGNGLGSALVRFIEDRMREVGMKLSYLETHSNLQTAIHMYEKLGYVRIERPAAVAHGTMDHFYIKAL